jgi:hypothetical protein
LISETGAFELTARPHCLQKRLPGVKAAPHRKQDRSASSGAAKGSNCTGIAIMGMA